MRRLIPVMAVLVVAGSFLAFRPADTTSDAGELVGVWKLVHRTSPAGEGSEVTDPNLLIYTEGYYASLGGSADREELPEEPTDEQRLAAWGPFGANAGSYEVRSNERHSTVIIAKNPNAIGAERVATFVVEGNSLTVTQSNGAVLRYTRLE